MKKVLLIVSVLGLVLFLRASSSAAPAATVPVGADLTKATIVTQVDLPALLSRKNYRLGMRVGILSPNDNLTVTKDTPFSFGFDFDAKLNENLDMGPRFTYLSKKFVNSASVNANYGVLMFGFGGRIYLTYFGDYGSTHGFANVYVALDGNYVVASKADGIATSPASFAGFMGNGGVGVELAFGPNTTGFVDARYQKASVKDSASNEFPLDGYAITAGARMAFF